MDFTIIKYQSLLKALQKQGYSFITFSQYCKGEYPEKYVILRHDVDLLPYNSLRFAKIQAELGIKGSYYFRAVPKSWNEAVIKEIAALGHEVGYHYENLTTHNGDLNAGITDFKTHLNALRELVPVSTICMHGSPRSQHDSKDLWKENNYRDYGIIGEPYFDADFDDLFYLTDTGRRWDGWKTSVRDKVPQQEQWNTQGLTFHSTDDIINALQRKSNSSTQKHLNNSTIQQFNDSTIQKSINKPRPTDLPTYRLTDLKDFPDRVMMTFHPQRWHDKPLPWLKELVLQNAKNVVKRFLVSK